MGGWGGRRYIYYINVDSIYTAAGDRGNRGECAVAVV